MLALDQDALGKQAIRAASLGAIDVFKKDLEDGSTALGFFNRGQQTESGHFNKLPRIGLEGSYHVRDLWRQIDLPDAREAIDVSVPAHGVLLLRLTAVTKP